MKALVILLAAVTPLCGQRISQDVAMSGDIFVSGISESGSWAGVDGAEFNDVCWSIAPDLPYASEPPQICWGGGSISPWSSGATFPDGTSAILSFTSTGQDSFSSTAFGFEASGTGLFREQGFAPTAADWSFYGYSDNSITPDCGWGVATFRTVPDALNSLLLLASCTIALVSFRYRRLLSAWQSGQ